MDFTQYLQNKDQFVQSIKDELSKRTFNEVDELKKEMANDFLDQEQE